MFFLFLKEAHTKRPTAIGVKVKEIVYKKWKIPSKIPFQKKVIGEKYTVYLLIRATPDYPLPQESG
jgi:hypothetical protein